MSSATAPRVGGVIAQSVIVISKRDLGYKGLLGVGAGINVFIYLFVAL